MWLNTPADFETLSNTVGAWMLTLYADACLIYFCLVADMWSSTCAIVFLVVSSLAMWSLLKVMLSDPGAVPSGATASGMFATYPGGGYVVDLPINATRSSGRPAGRSGRAP